MAEDYHYWTCRCGAKQAMSREAYNIYKQSHASFHCVHGHTSYWPEGETAEDKLRQERDALKQRQAYYEGAYIHT